MEAIRAASMSISTPSSINSFGPIGFIKPTRAYFFLARCISDRLMVVLPQCCPVAAMKIFLHIFFGPVRIFFQGLVPNYRDYTTFLTGGATWYTFLAHTGQSGENSYDFPRWHSGRVALPLNQSLLDAGEIFCNNPAVQTAVCSYQNALPFNNRGKRSQQ